jgi:hypothetical protein
MDLALEPPFAARDLIDALQASWDIPVMPHPCARSRRTLEKATLGWCASGTCILEALQGIPDAPARYDRFLDHELCKDLRCARVAAAEDPTLRETNTAAVSGTVDYRTLVLQMARSAPTLIRALLTRPWSPVKVPA